MNGCLNIKIFPTKILHLENFRYYILYGYNLLITRVCHVMLGHGILKYFCPFLCKKTPPEDKKLPDPPGPLSKVIPSSIASCNTEVTRVLKQAKWSVTKNFYTKLTPVLAGSLTSL